MQDFEEIIKKLENLSDQLEPEEGSQMRTKNIIFSKTIIPHGQRENQNKNRNIYFLPHQIMKIFKSKIFLSLASTFTLGIFLITPFLFNTLKEKAKTSQAPIEVYENVDSSSNSVDNETAGSIEAKRSEVTAAEPSMLIDESAIREETYKNTEILDQPKAVAYTTKANEDTSTPADDRAQKREASISIAVENFTKSHTELTNKITSIGGYLQSSNMNTRNDYSYGTFAVRVPVDKFDELMNFTRSLALRVTSENISLQDKQNELTQILKSIDTTQKSIDELENLNKTLNRNLTKEEQAKLESLKNSQQNNKMQEEILRKQTEFSTVNITINTDIKKIDTNEWSLENTWNGVYKNITVITQFWITILMNLLIPITFITPVVLIIFTIVKYRKWRTPKN